MGERTPLFCPVPVAVSAKHKSLHNTVIGSRLGNASVGGGRNADTNTVGCVLLSLGMAPGLTRLDAKLVEGKYHLFLHLYEISTSCVTVTSFDPADTAESKG